MPDFTKGLDLSSLDQLKVQSPQGPSRDPYSPAGTTRDSNFLQGLTYDRNPEYVKAANQGFFSSMGNAVAQVATGLPLEVLEGVGYLGVGNIVDKVLGTEQEFGNTISNKLREWNNKIKEEGAPVYTTSEDEGFQPLNYKWWAQNAPSVASAISLLIPAVVGTKALSAAGKLARASTGLKLAQKLGMYSEAVTGTMESLTMAGLSRHMENMMEGMETYQALYDQAKEKGLSDDEAQRIGGQGATETYLKNWPLVLGDIVQFGLAFKSFKNISRIKTIEEASKKSILSAGASLGLNAGIEAGEEGYQFITQEEAKRNTAVKNNLQKDDYSTYSERLMKYATDGDFWTSSFFGALGGGVFEATGSIAEKRSGDKQKIIDDVQKSALEKTIAIVSKDPIAFQKSTGTDLHKVILAGITSGRADAVEQMLNDMKEGKHDGLSEEEKNDNIQKAETGLADLKYLENLYNNIGKDTSRTSQDIRFELANRAELLTNQRILTKLNEEQANHISTISSERGLPADYAKLLQAETELKTINDFFSKFKGEGAPSKEVLDNKIKTLKDSITQFRDTIKTREQITDDQINQKIKVNAPLLHKASYDKMMYDIKVDQINKDYDELQSPDGRKKVNEELNKFEEQQRNKELIKAIGSITKNSTPEQVKQAKEAAVNVGKEKEFLEGYNSTILQYKKAAPQFNPQAPDGSLGERWRDNNLLMSQETAEIAKIAIKTGGFNSGSADMTPANIADSYLKNPTFAKQVNEYFAKSASITSVPKKDDIGKQGTSENTQSQDNTNGEAAKTQKESLAKNKNAWNLQGVQFEMNEKGIPDINKPSTSNVAKKIDWEYLNQNNLPENAELHFEYDFEDEWNLKNKLNMPNIFQASTLLNLTNSERIFSDNDLRLFVDKILKVDFTKDLNLNEIKEKAKNWISNNTPANNALFELVHYIDGNTNNKQSSNRKIVGVLSSYVEDITYESIEAKSQLKYLRSKLYSQVQASHFSTGYVTLDTTTKVDKVIGGRFWNTNKFNNPKEVLRNDTPLILAVGIKKKVGKESVNVLETNGHPLTSRIAYDGNNITPGGAYMLLPNYGELIPYKLFTKKAKEFLGLADEVASRIQYIANTKDAITKKQMIDELSIEVDIKDVNHNGDTYFIETGDRNNPIIIQAKENELSTAAGNLIVQVDVKSINKGEYNDQLAEKGYITTDVNPLTYFHSTKVVIKPITDFNTESKLEDTKVSPKDETKKQRGRPKKIKGTGKVDISFGEGDPKHSQTVEGLQFSPLNEKEVNDWMKRNLPQVPISIVENLINIDKEGGAKAWGVFYKGAIELYKAAPQGTEHHEAFHAIFNMFLSSKEKESILSEGAILYNRNKETEELKIEEDLANDFVRYVQQNKTNENTLGYNIKLFFKKLLDFFKSIFTSDINIETLYHRINTGTYKNEKIEKSNAIRYSSVNPNPYITKRNISTINYYFFKALDNFRNENSLGDATDINVIKKVSPKLTDGVFNLYSQVYNGILDAREDALTNNKQDLVDELDELLDNFIITDDEGNITGTGDYYTLALRDLAKYGIKFSVNGVLSTAYDSQTDEQQFEINEEEDALEGWQIKAVEVNGKDTLSFNVRKTLRQTTQYELVNGEFKESQDKYGFKRFVNFDEVYNYLESNLADTFTADDMLDKMEDLQYHRPEIYGILDRLYNNESLKTQFFTNFAKAYMPFYQVLQRVNSYITEEGRVKNTKYTIYNANRKNIYQLLIDEWNDNLINPSRNHVTDKESNIDKTKAKTLLNNYNTVASEIKKARKVTSEQNNKISDILLEFGIDIDAETLQKEFVEKRKRVGNQMITTKPFDSYIDFISGDNSIQSIITAITGGINPYQGDDIESTTIRAVTRIVARNVTNLHQDTFINIEKKQVYSYVLPTFLNKKFEELKTTDGINDYLSNWWFARNKWLQDLQGDEIVRNQFNIVMLDGILPNNRDGIKYYNLTDTGLDTADLNMYDNNNSNKFAYYRLPILSDSPQSPYVRFKKYNQGEVVTALYQLALAEKERILLSQATDIKIKNWNDETNNGKSYQFIDIFNDSNIDIDNEDSAKQAIINWLDNSLTNETNRLKENKVLRVDGGFNGTVSDIAARNKDFLKSYFYNKVLANAMLTQITSVDLAFYKDGDDFQKRNAQIFKFTKMIDTEANWNGFTPEKTYNSIYVKDEIIKSELVESVYKTLVDMKYPKAYAREMANIYEKVNQTDAQAYITIDRYKKIKIGTGEWTDEHEAAYKLIKKGKAYDDAFGLLFQPIKPFYYNHSLIPGTNLIIPTQNKNSEVVLLPNLAKKSKKLSKLLSFMEKNNIDSVQFASAVKAGQFGVTSIDNIEEAQVHTLDNKYYGIQQETPEHHIDTENLFGSQLRKLILADIPDNTKFGNYTKKEIFDNYQKLLVDNITESYNSVAEEFNDINKIQRTLLEQVIERNLGEYYENAIKLVQNSQGNTVFNLPLYHPIHAKKFEAILNSIVRNNVTKQKINGGNFVLMSNYGFSDNLKVVTNKETGAVEYMEVMLPAWTKRLFPRLPNGEVDIEQIKQDDPTILDLFGYRIPTEHKYSMKKLKIVGFTPDLMGGIAILPAEITTIAGEDFDIDKMYTIIPNIESKDGKLQKIKYDLAATNLTKEQRDNALLDILNSIWSNPAISDQILIPGGFDTLKSLATSVRTNTLEGVGFYNPILPGTQMNYFQRNTNGSKLIAIAANHNTNHAVLQYTKAQLKRQITFDGNKLQDLNKIKALDGKLISRNLAEFLAAFVDNAKEPVATDLNLNTYTFDTVAMIVRLGYSLETAIYFINQPIIRELTKEYYRNGATRLAEKKAKDIVRDYLTKNRKIELPGKGVYLLNTEDMKRRLFSLPFKVGIRDEEATYQMQVFHTFNEYKALASSLGKVVRATKVDTLGTRKTIAGNQAAMWDVDKAQENTDITGISDLFQRDIYPLVKASTEYGLIKPQKELLSKYFPYGKAAYTTLQETLSLNKGSDLTEDELNQVNNITLAYYTSGFGFFKPNQKNTYITKFPTHFLKFKDDNAINKFELMRYLRFKGKDQNYSIDRIEFTSSATISNEQREILTNSWKAMLESDDTTISKLGRDLVHYSFHTTGFGFTYGGFANLIPTDYLDKLVDDQGINFRDYLYKLQDEAESADTFSSLVEQIYRHDTIGSLLPRLDNSDIENKIATKGIVSSIVLKPKPETSEEKDVVRYFRYQNPRGEYRLYKYAGVTATGNEVYNLVPSLGEGNIVEYSNLETPTSILPINNLPEFKEKDYYTTTDASDAGQEYYQVNDARILEIKYELVDAYGKYKKLGKDGKGISSTKIYRAVLENVAKVNNNIRGTGYVAKIGKTVENNEVFYIIQIVDQYAQLSSEAKPNEELNDMLKQWFTKVGGKIEYYNDLIQRIGGDVNAVADIGKKLILVAKNSEGLNTLPEEIGHFAEAFNRGTGAHNILMEYIELTPEYKEVIEKYSSIYDGNILKLKQEAIGQLIGKAIIKKYEETKPKGVIMSLLQKMWNSFIDLFKKENEVEYQQRIEDITGKIAEDILSGNTELPNSITIDGKFYQLGESGIIEARELLKKGVDSVYKKIKIYERKALTEFTDRERNILNKLINEFEKKNYQKGLLDYTINAKRELRKVAKRYSNINRNPETLEDKRNTLKTLHQMNNYVKGFKDTMDGIAKSEVFTGTTANEKLVSRFVSETAELVNKLESEYYKIGKPILANVLREFSTNPNVDIGTALDILEKDISWTQRFLDQLAETDDSILNIVDVMAKDAKQRSRLLTLDQAKTIIKAQKELEASGTPTSQFMTERDFDGNITGNLLTEYNIGEFERKRKEFSKTLERTLTKQEKAQQLALWYQENTQVHSGKDEIIKNKKEELSKIYLNTKLAAQKYNEWYAKNTRQSTYFDPDSGQQTFETRYIKELSLPAERYKNKVYDSVQENPGQKKYYDLMIDLINNANTKLPEVYKLNGITPQVRKDFFDRLYFEDNQGKKRLKSLKGIYKETGNTLADQIVRHESDIQYGLTDESNQPINMIPVYFTRRMSDPTNLSLDFSSNLIAFLYSVNDFSEMSKIIDTLEFTKDVVGQRKVKTGKFDPVTLFKKEGNEKPITKDGKDSHAYKRLEDWMNMVVYGRSNKDEGGIGKVDYGKLADFVNTYTSLNSLALNIYSGISNITVGNAMVRMEGIANEFVENKDLFVASKIYASEIPEVLGNIGQRLQTSKLDLWLEHMDTMQNYDREFRDIDAGRNTVASRLFKTSTLYFVNHAGEHWIQTRMSLALANNTKVKDLLGNEMTLWEAFEVVNDRLVIKPNLQKVGGKKSSSLFKKSEDGQALTDRDIIRFINRQNFINKRLHGIYNSVDKSAIQQYALGRLAIMFRKFIKPGWNRRFAKLTYNEEGEAFTEGYYTTLGRFIKRTYNELKEGKLSIVKNWGELTDTEKANFFRTFTEWAYLVASITAANVLTQFADDDDDNYLLNLSAYEAYRMYSEIRFFTSFTEMWRIVKSPAPAVYQIDKISKFLQVWNWGKEVERGKYKGLNRFEVGTIELLPLVGTYTNFKTPEEQLRFYTNNGVSIF